MRKKTRNQNAVVGASGEGAPDKKPSCKRKDWESERWRQSLRGPLFSGSCRDRWGVSLGSKVRWGMERKGDCKLAVALM